ncbi:MAG: PAS domain-containing sensor histidine kinase [Bacteroidetes bacterium]|nr:MAG: PAS domain-containing sensor histidine kinase [Bacteroidota bacterium]REJ99998.1 MAG: PAS domain-containing sensor histidine kinase [Bacteroidota bacterium]REK35822.1 MAG: PAS domain-containing sensor histidine kinase [Bacteroidota bacterium]REK49307.1 MAG: PAS domain-containing sensor histidine kinase [Bacteroidota bacterium]
MLNKLLLRQLQKRSISPETLPPEMQSLLNDISSSYEHFNKDREMLERSIDLTSQEMKELNHKLKQETLEVKKAHEELKNFFMNIEEVFYSIDLVNYKLIHISPGCEKMFGYSQAEFEANPHLWRSLILQEDLPVYDEAISNVLIGKSHICCLRIRHLNKSIKWLELKMTSHINASGEIIRFDGVSNDITGRKEAENTVKENENRFRSLIENSNEGIILLNENGECLFASRSSEKILQKPHDSLISNNFFNIILEEDLETMSETFRMLKENPGETFNCTVRIYGENGEVMWIDSDSTNLMHVKGIEAIVTNFRDVTDRINTLDLLKAKNSDLEKTNIELDKFVYSVTHDLRAPLSSILGLIQMVKDDNANHELEENIDMIHASVLKLDSFIQDILDYARNSRTEVRGDAIDFGEMISEICGNLKFMNRQNKQVNIVTKLHLTNNFISDKGRIRILLNNLISNAIKYQNQNCPDPMISINVDTSDTEADIVVKDNGIGIDKALHDKIFDMFYRVSNISSGNGLGLYIVKEAVNKLNGSIVVDSEPGKGTEFRIKIPNIYSQNSN